MSAAIAAVVVGGVAAAGGAYMSSKAAGAAADAAQAGTEASLAMQQKGLDFQMKIYEEQMSQVAALEDIFGPVRDNLAQYYNNI